MKSVTSYSEWNELLGEGKSLLLFVKATNCSVCDGLLPQVEAIAPDTPFPFYKVNVTEVPEIAGQLSLFTAPVVLLFSEGKEYARFARFVPIGELKRRLTELSVRRDDNA